MVRHVDIRAVLSSTSSSSLIAASFGGKALLTAACAACSDEHGITPSGSYEVRCSNGAYSEAN